MRDAFELELSDAEAASHFRDRIRESLETKTTQFNDMIHVIAHS